MGRQLASRAQQFAGRFSSEWSLYQKAWYFTPNRLIENFQAGNDDDPKVHKIPTLNTFTGVNGDPPMTVSGSSTTATPPRAR